MSTATPAASEIRLIEALRGRRVLVLGDAMLDRYLWGRVERISPEAPVPVVDVERESFSLGGAANVAHNITALGGEAVLLSVVGEDASGEQIRSVLARAGVRAESVVADPERRTTVKTRILAHQQQVVRADEEDTEPVRGPALRRLLATLERLAPEVDAIVVSDYGKGVVHPETIRPAISLARAHQVTVSVDPKQDHFPSYQGATVLTPNQLEAGQAFGRRIVDEASLAEVGWGLRERCDLDCLVVTRGPDGMSLFERSGRHTHLPTVAREVFDVTGAGDTVVAVMALALAAGADFVTAASLANHAAGRVIRHAGTAVVSAEELKATFAPAESD
ncbi:MAG TPA: D-glycero-beta-D-manno-heptose-7-phosphate kinase [Candidatus Eisenbacteria bacterium]|nr:D-glycero-beta-D-manno-heptose-7-phosphate kinase [Candidatus Eisenbacteria bacterium]